MSVTLWPRAIAYSTCSGPVNPVPPRIKMSSAALARSTGSRRTSPGSTSPSASFGAPNPVAPRAPAPATAADTLRNVRRSVDTNDLPGGGGLNGGERVGAHQTGRPVANCRSSSMARCPRNQQMDDRASLYGNCFLTLRLTLRGGSGKGIAARPGRRGDARRPLLLLVELQ